MAWKMHCCVMAFPHFYLSSLMQTVPLWCYIPHPVLKFLAALDQLGGGGGGGDLEWWVQHYVSIEHLLNCNMDMIYLSFEMRHNNISGCVIRSMVISVALTPTHTNG